MAKQLTDPETPTKKYGSAVDVTFGTKQMNDGDVTFTVVTSQSVSSSFQTNQQLKNEAGITVGSVIGDPKIDLTVSGYSDKAPAKLGQVAELSTFVGGIQGGAGNFGDDDASNKSFLITGAKEDRSNEDFLQFEITGECYPNVDYDETADLKSDDDMYG